MYGGDRPARTSTRNQTTWTLLLHRSLGRPGTAGGDGVVVVVSVTIRAIGPFAAVDFGEIERDSRLVS
jgi:hypothetical protein